MSAFLQFPFRSLSSEFGDRLTTCPGWSQPLNCVAGRGLICLDGCMDMSSVKQQITERDKAVQRVVGGVETVTTSVKKQECVDHS